ncbi:MAG: GMC family oxidoreductase [Deltaproteobacteria bacterium]|nr:MAG: GMC family oxidoreductase [Deltaproteobacteria bacterium]
MASQNPGPTGSPVVDTFSSNQELVDQARDKDTTPFDYIIVGSGAGGGPLAARLALAGKKVLVIEAGSDPARTKSLGYPEAELGEVTRVPGYQGAATEDAEMSWMFSVRHYADSARQARDQKYNKIPIDPNTGQKLATKFLDPHPHNGGRQGILYPRSSGIGGCTGHHAMITIAPNDKDWNYIADLTGDESWRADRSLRSFSR